MVLSLFLVPAGFYAVLALRIGSSTYQTWKLVATVQPLALIVVGALSVCGAEIMIVRTIGQRAQRTQVLRFLAAIPVIAAALIAMRVGQGTWDDAVAARATFRSRFAHPELVAAGRDRRVRSQPSLTVSLSPYFETMVAPVVADLHNVTFGVDTYRGPGTGPGRCALTRAEPGARAEKEAIRIVGDLVLTPQAGCDIVNIR